MNGKPDPAFVGFACAYAPLPLVHAAGLTPYRILPMGGSEDRAGRLMHDNLCPHVKRILDRGLANDLPALEGLVWINSCDAMRRLADAWALARPGDRRILLDLPVTGGERSIDYYAAELSRLRAALGEWTGREITDESIRLAVARANDLAGLLASARGRLRRGTLAASRMQALCVGASTSPLAGTLSALRGLAAEPETRRSPGVPVFLFGNVLPDPEAFDLVEACGARVVDDDLCTGSRLFHRVDLADAEDPIRALSRSLLARPPCARTLTASQPGRIAAEVVSRARAAGARGAIAHVLKFCDPYLARMPAIREALGKDGMPLLVLEGDCTLRAVGQHRTRIEAFVEMLA